MPLEPEQVHQQVLAIARAQLALGPDELSVLAETTDLVEQLDSVQRLTLVVAIEDHFEICFEPEDDDQAVTLDDVTRIVLLRLTPA